MNNHTIKKPNAKFVTNGAGFVEMMNSSQMKSILQDEAQKKANALTTGDKTYRVDVVGGSTKAVAFLAADSYEALISNLQNNDLTKALL